MKNPLAYINSNILGFAHILENCRQYDIQHLVYASTSSVYGANAKIPFSENIWYALVISSRLALAVNVKAVCL